MNIMLPKYKDIMDLVKKGATLEAQEKIMELREAAIELQDENHELKQKIRELGAELRLKQEVVWEKPSYWVIKGKAKDGPFCQKCHDVDNNLVRLQGGKNDFWRCKACNSTYKGPSYVAPDLRIPTARY